MTRPQRTGSRMKLRRTFGLTMIYVILSSSNLFAQTRDLRNARTHPVPITFDEDKVELPESPRVAHEANITVGGTFRNSCERSIETRVESPDAHTHYVKAVALSLVDYACAQVERDYSPSGLARPAGRRGPRADGRRRPRQLRGALLHGRTLDAPARHDAIE